MKPESITHRVNRLSDNHLGLSVSLLDRRHHSTTDFGPDGVHLYLLGAEKGVCNHGGELRRYGVGDHFAQGS